uniref:hypothetical protein n=1 Tax=Alistipes putredinis TaxID=28117 RepID=UPI003FD74BF0
LREAFPGDGIFSCGVHFDTSSLQSYEKNGKVPKVSPVLATLPAGMCAGMIPSAVCRRCIQERLLPGCVEHSDKKVIFVL